MTIQERAWKFVAEAPVDRFMHDIATDFATLEREKAVREFLEKANEKYQAIQHNQPITGREYAIKDAFREMFNKEL